MCAGVRAKSTASHVCMCSALAKFYHHHFWLVLSRSFYLHFILPLIIFYCYFNRMFDRLVCVHIKRNTSNITESLYIQIKLYIHFLRSGRLLLIVVVVCYYITFVITTFYVCAMCAAISLFFYLTIEYR